MTDFIFAIRQLRKNPGFTAAAVLTLALGIGATTTVFSVVNGVLLQPLDYPGSDRIVNVWESDPERGFTYRRSSPANFVDWKEEAQSFEAMAFAAHHSGWVTLGFIYTGEAYAKRLPGRFVSSDFFKVFGVEPILGRTFLPDEEIRGSRRVIVLSHELWQRLYEGAPDVVGKSINLENQGRHAYEIIGVMPEGFRYPGADLWVSCAHMPRPMTRRGGTMIHVVGRLKEGVSLASAETEMNAIQARIHAEYGHLERQFPNLAMGRQVCLQPLIESMVSSARPSLMVFSGAVALVLLIACANVANLLLSRSLSRRREISVRVSLGAGRWRIMRQLLAESVALSLAGGVVGVLLAYWGTRLVVQFNAGSIPRIEMATLDAEVLLFALLASVATGLLFGLAPAWQSSKVNLAEDLKEGGGRASAGRAPQRLRNAFTVAQIALALILSIGAGLLIQSFQRLQSVEPGFDAEQVLTVEFAMTGASYENQEQRLGFLRRLMDQLSETPGVEAVSAVSMIPDRPAWPFPFARTDHEIPPLADWPRAGVRVVSSNYLKSYGIAQLRGREFEESDSFGAEPVALVNETFAKKVFAGEDPLDKQIECQGETRRIVGVFADVKNTGLAGETEPEICVPYGQWPFQSMFLSLRARTNPEALEPIVTEQVRDLNPGQPMKYFSTIQHYLDRSAARPRFRSMVLGWFALAALVLAGVGIYGVMAYAVAQRSHEIGIRMALGARKADVMKLVLRHGMSLALIGIAIGSLGSLALIRAIESHLFGVTATDGRTYLGVSLLLAGVAAAASLAPAMRAMRVNPTQALRQE